MRGNDRLRSDGSVRRWSSFERIGSSVGCFFSFLVLLATQVLSYLHIARTNTRGALSRSTPPWLVPVSRTMTGILTCLTSPVKCLGPRSSRSYSEGRALKHSSECSGTIPHPSCTAYTLQKRSQHLWKQQRTWHVAILRSNSGFFQLLALLQFDLDAKVYRRILSAWPRWSATTEGSEPRAQPTVVANSSVSTRPLHLLRRQVKQQQLLLPPFVHLQLLSSRRRPALQLHVPSLLSSPSLLTQPSLLSLPSLLKLLR